MFGNIQSLLNQCNGFDKFGSKRSEKKRELGQQIHVVGVDGSPEMVGGLPWMVAVRCRIHVVGCRPLLLRQPLPLQPPSVGKNHLAKPLPDNYVTFRFSKNDVDRHGYT